MFKINIKNIFLRCQCSASEVETHKNAFADTAPILRKTAGEVADNFDESVVNFLEEQLFLASSSC